MMAHCLSLFVGTQQNLQDIFNACPDSSSESAAEMAFGADWINEDDDAWGSGEFTKFTKEIKGTCHLDYQDVIKGNWYDCYDIRDINHYGSFDCLNCSDFEPYDRTNSEDGKYDKDWIEKEKRNKSRTIEALKELPDDTIFFFVNSHY